MTSKKRGQTDSSFQPADLESDALPLAITRATELKNVLFYNCGHGIKIPDELLHEYLTDKIECFARQDRQAGRTIEDKYINMKWLKGQLGKRGPSCGDCFRFDTAEIKIFHCNPTADRINNDEGHHLNNIVPLRRMRNMSKGNRE
jgi:hypothetical protein